MTKQNKAISANAPSIMGEFLILFSEWQKREYFTETKEALVAANSTLFSIIKTLCHE